MISHLFYVLHDFLLCQCCFWVCFNLGFWSSVHYLVSPVFLQTMQISFGDLLGADLATNITEITCNYHRLPWPTLVSFKSSFVPSVLFIEPQAVCSPKKCCSLTCRSWEGTEHFQRMRRWYFYDFFFMYSSLFFTSIVWHQWQVSSFFSSSFIKFP